MLILIVALTFACIALGVMSLYWLLARPANVVTARLESMDQLRFILHVTEATQHVVRVLEEFPR